MTDLAFRRVYLDSNIIISFVRGDADAEIARLLVDMIAAVRPSATTPFATSELSLAETMVWPLREGSADHAQSFDNIITTSGWMSVGGVDRTTLLWAASARAKYPHLKLPDAIHVASAVGLDCDHILTADSGIHDEYVLDPPVWRPGGASAPPLAVCRPNKATLLEIIEWIRSR